MDDDERRLMRTQYYHGMLPRHDSEEMIVQQGDFLVRRSKDSGGNVFILSTKTDGGENFHLTFRQNDDLITVDPKHERGYRSIERFCEEHMKRKDSVSSARHIVLIRPIARKSWELASSDVKEQQQLKGVVFRGLLREQQEVAIKKAKGDARAIFHEARVLRLMDHNNVIRFHGVTIDRAAPMIVMELSTGGPLNEYLAANKRSLRSKLYMCLGAAAGLVHIHSKGVIHCGIGAQNCLFTNERTKITNFSAAVCGLIATTQTNKLMKHNAPETLRQQTMTEKSDVWAFGVLCQEIIGDGAAPFQGFSQEVAQQMIQRGESPAMPAATPDLLAEYLRANIFEADPNRRTTMGPAYDWLDRNLRKMF